MNGHAQTIRNGRNAQPTSDFLPSEQLSLKDLAVRIDEKVQRFLKEEPKTEQIRHVQEQTEISLKVIREVFQRYDLDEISLSYNGGKDCLVLLILYIAALASHPSLHSEPPTSSTQPSNSNPQTALLKTIPSVYIISAHPFPEVETFVRSTTATYSLDLTRYDKDMKAAFEDYLNVNPKIKAIFVGTRRTDPHGGKLTHFDETDHGWPRFMRIHPVIDWCYVDIWTFICHLGIPYCPLYDMGYTSLGGTQDTHPNPALRRSSIGGGGEQLIEFRPAYELVEDGEERLGREKEWKAIMSSTASEGKIKGERRGSMMHRVEGSGQEVADGKPS